MQSPQVKFTVFQEFANFMQIMKSTLWCWQNSTPRILITQFLKKLTFKHDSLIALWKQVKMKQAHGCMRRIRVFSRGFDNIAISCNRT